MTDCPLLTGCLFFNDKMPDTSGLGAMYKKKYCQGDNSQCDMHMIVKSVGREKVPTNLYPNMLDRAQTIIAQR
jgi:hypothetical protein